MGHDVDLLLWIQRSNSSSNLCVAGFVIMYLSLSFSFFGSAPSAPPPPSQLLSSRDDTPISSLSRYPIHHIIIDPHHRYYLNLNQSITISSHHHQPWSRIRATFLFCLAVPSLWKQSRALGWGAIVGPRSFAHSVRHVGRFHSSSSWSRRVWMSLGSTFHMVIMRVIRRAWIDWDRLRRIWTKMLVREQTTCNI